MEDSATSIFGRPSGREITESIPLSRTHMIDRKGWHFTNNGKYSVKSGYRVEQVYPDKINS